MKILVAESPAHAAAKILSFEEMKKEPGVYQQVGQICHDGDLVINSHLGLFYVNLKGDNQVIRMEGNGGDAFRYVKTNRVITLTFGSE